MLASNADALFTWLPILEACKQCTHSLATLDYKTITDYNQTTIVARLYNEHTAKALVVWLSDLTVRSTKWY